MALTWSFTVWREIHNERAIYAKLDVSSRAELSAKLFHEHIAPHLDDERVREFPTAAV